VGFVAVLSAGAAAVFAPRLWVAIRYLAALVFALLALFCVWGFAASFEPGDYHDVWRVVYGVAFLACLVSLVRLVFAKPA